MWYILLLPIVGAYFYRMRGGLPPKLPRPIDQILFSLPYGYIAYTLEGYTIAIVVLVLTTLAVATGHGGFMDLGTWEKDREEETLEFIIRKWKAHLAEDWYDFLGLALTGMVVSLPAGIVVALSYPALGIALAASGCLKSVAYLIPLKLGIPKFTAIGEWLTGFFLWGACAITLCVLTNH